MSEKVKEKKISLPVIASWFFGCLFLVTAIPQFLMSPMSLIVGLAFFIAALLLLPPVRSKVYEQTNTSITGGVRFILVLVILVTAGYVEANDVTDNSSSKVNYNESVELDAGSLEQKAEAEIQKEIQRLDEKKAAYDFETIKNEIIDRCKNSMAEMGASIVKVCVDEDIKAYKSIQEYPEQHRNFITRCEGTMGSMGWSIIKVCADEDIKADAALSDY